MGNFTVALGQFENVSGSFSISDPGFRNDSRFIGVLTDVKTGTWNAEVEIYDDGDGDERVAVLTVTHDSATKESIDYVTEADFDVLVDGGQAGIFDTSHYMDDTVFGKKQPKHKFSLGKAGDRWYNFCCDATQRTAHEAGIIPYGVVSRSGFGDGVYECIISLDYDGDIVKVSIPFIEHEDDSDED